MVCFECISSRAASLRVRSLSSSLSSRPLVGSAWATGILLGSTPTAPYTWQVTPSSPMYTSL